MKNPLAFRQGRTSINNSYSRRKKAVLITLLCVWGFVPWLFLVCLLVLLLVLLLALVVALGGFVLLPVPSLVGFWSLRLLRSLGLRLLLVVGLAVVVALSLCGGLSSAGLFLFLFLSSFFGGALSSLFF